jgi:hypothetical protein
MVFDWIWHIDQNIQMGMRAGKSEVRSCRLSIVVSGLPIAVSRFTIDNSRFTKKSAMRFIKLAIISAVILFLLVLGMSLLIPSHIRISRAVDITASKENLLPAISDLRQWKEWNVMVNDADSTVKEYTENAIKADKLTITKQALVGDTLFTSWQQHNARSFVSGITWQGNDERLVVQWYFDIQLRWYPWEKFGSIVFDKQLGPSMEKSLGNLKKLVEKKP